MPIPVYVINLERSRARWEALQKRANDLDLHLRRVEAVDGRHLDKVQLTNFDEASFRRLHGKTPLPGEIGCYFSHLKALQIIADGDDNCAVIIEDDVLFANDFNEVIEELQDIQGWDVIKLINNRVKFFQSKYVTIGGVDVGCCMHGPLGCAGGYMVTRDGAKKLLNTISKMELPYDVALERGWSGGYRVYIVKDAVIQLANELGSTILEGGASYKRVRFPAWKRLGALKFRTTDYIRRMIYALRKSTLFIGDK
ncbi:glycosyltransferase family 25 protein [Paenochrobactrum sp. BZR 588]|uniref:glycosyltransferase family 25 protein n=1 Tax=unclassified Paenochrobactrum TaxID=2639760 RepID=UPI00385411F9